MYEAAPTAGGQVRIAASVASRAEFGDLVRNQEAELKRVGGKLECAVTVDLAMIRRLRPDAVVIATGATPARPPWMPAEPPIPTCDVRDVLEGKAHPTGTVLLIDELGFHQSTSVAELLADRGASVEVLTPGMVVAQDLGITLDLEGWNIRAAAKGITQTPDSVIMGFERGRRSRCALRAAPPDRHDGLAPRRLDRAGRPARAGRRALPRAEGGLPRARRSSSIGSATRSLPAGRMRP